VIEGIVGQFRESGVFKDKYALHVRPIGENRDGDDNEPDDNPDDDLDTNDCPSTPEVCGHHNNVASPCPYLLDFSDIHPCDCHQHGAYQILQGHHRLEAARRADIEVIPCWSEPMDDERAYMELVLGNQQRELSPLEIGVHALKNVFLSEGGRGKEGGLRDYARQIGSAPSKVSEYRQAAEVYQSIKCSHEGTDFFLDKARHLSAIHKAPAPSWPALVSTLVDDGWSFKETEKQVTFLSEVVASIPS
jgi:hypothetical protein